MKKNYHLLLAAFLVSLITFAQRPRDIAPGELIVSVIDNDKITELTKDLRLVNGQPTNISVDRLLAKRMHAWLLKFDPDFDHESILNAVKSHPQTLIAQYNHTGIVSRATAPDDPEYSKQWFHKNTGQVGGKGVGVDLDSEIAWDIATGGLSAHGDTIIVAVVDGGGGRGHIDMNYWNNYAEIPNNSIDDDNNGYVDDYAGWNIINDNDQIDFSSHAAQCSGLIGAIGNNAEGVAGVNWDVQIMPVQALWSSGASNSTIEAYVVEGFTYVLDQRDLYNKSNGSEGSFVVAMNNSFGKDGGKAVDFPIWCAMYDSLGKVGILTASACTNKKENADYGDMPSVCPSDFIIPVMCSTYEDKMPVQSFGSSGGVGYGPTVVDLAAPTSIYTVSGSSSSYGGTQQGSSFSAPLVTGAISLLVAGACPLLLDEYKSNPESTLRLLRSFILDNVEHPPAFAGKNSTDGRLNVGSAMLAMDAHCTLLSNGLTEYGNVEVKAVFPNPTTDRLNVNIGNQNLRSAELRITSLLGQVVYVERYNEVRRTTNIKLDVSDFTPGYYFVTIRDEMGNEVVQQFVKQ